MYPERLRQIGVEGSSVGGDGRLQYRVPDSLVIFGAGRTADRAVVEADNLAGIPPDLAGEDMARNATAVAAGEIPGNSTDFGNPGDKRITRGRLALQGGKADEVIA